MTKSGKSKTQALAYLSNENNVFNREGAVKQEIAHIIGDILGLILGVIVFF